MKGIDTNILVRYLVQDDAKQGEIAANYFETLKSEGETCFIRMSPEYPTVLQLRDEWRPASKLTEGNLYGKYSGNLEPLPL